MVLVIVAILMVPIMLFVKPIHFKMTQAHHHAPIERNDSQSRPQTTNGV